MRSLLLSLLFLSNAALADAQAWMGAYAGVGLGAARAKSSWVTDATVAPATEVVEHRAGNVLGGGQLGWNFGAIGPLVVGVEAAIYGSHIEQRSNSDVAPDRERVTKILHPLHVAAHLGFATARTLTYLRGGFAYASIELQAINHQVGNVATWDSHATGWTAGGGFEYRLSRPWSLGLDYSYSSLRAVDLSALNSGGTTVHANDFKTTLQAALLRLNYRY